MNTIEMRARLRGLDYSSGKKKKEKKSTTNSITIKKTFNAARAMAQLANAKTKSQVSAIERSIRAQLPAMKKQEGSQEAVKQMKYVIQKANAKRIALTKEERLENSRKVAKSADNKKQETNFSKELKRRRNSRKRREIAEALNAPGIFDKKKDSVSIFSTEPQEETTYKPIDVVCDTFQVSTEMPKEVGGEIDTSL